METIWPLFYNNISDCLGKIFAINLCHDWRSSRRIVKTLFGLCKMAQPPDPVYSFRGNMKNILCMILATDRTGSSHGELCLLVGTAQGLVHHWNLKMKREVKQINVGEMPCVSLVETAIGYATLDKGESLTLWTHEWAIVKKISVEYCGFCNLDYFDGRLYFPHIDGRISVVQMNKDFEISELAYKYNKKQGELMHVKALTGTKNIVTCYESGLVTIWNSNDGKVVSETEISDTPMCADYCEKTSVLVVGSSGCTIHKLSVVNGVLELERTKNITNPGVSSISIRADGKLFVATCWDGKIRYFSTKNMTLLAVLENKAIANCAIFNSKDDPHCAQGHVLAGSSDGRVTWWNLYVKKNIPTEI